MPRMGIGMPLVSDTSSVAVTAIDDLLWRNYSDSDGEIAINYQETRTNLVRHSNFATDAIWAKTNTTISTSDKEATVRITDGGASSLSIPVSLTAGKTYTLSLEINGTADKEIRFQDKSDNSGGLNTDDSKITMTGQPQEVSRTWVANANSSEIVIARNTASGSYSFTVKNVQIEEGPERTAFIITEADAAVAVTTTLNDTSDVWDFDGADLTPEADPDSEGVWEEATANLVTNHDFATDSDWGLGTGWSISGGTANCIGGAGSLNLTQVALEIGRRYTVTYTVLNYSQGTVQVKMGGWTQGTLNTSNGTYTEVISNDHPSANTTIYIQGKSDFIGSIDNVTVKEYAITPLDV